MRVFDSDRYFQWDNSGARLRIAINSRESGEKTNANIARDFPLLFRSQRKETERESCVNAQFSPFWRKLGKINSIVVLFRDIIRDFCVPMRGKTA